MAQATDLSSAACFARTPTHAWWGQRVANPQGCHVLGQGDGCQAFPEGGGPPPPSFRAQPRAVVPVFNPGFALTLGACLASKLCRGRVRVHVGGLRKRGEGSAGRWERAVGAGKHVVWGAEGLWCPSAGYLVPERVQVSVHVPAHQSTPRSQVPYGHPAWHRPRQVLPEGTEPSDGGMSKKGDRHHAWGWL